MEANTLYKHINNTDVAFVADSVVDLDDHLILAIRWYNIVNLSNLYFIDYDEIKINKSKIKKWERVNVSTRGVF